jgi:uncharacterized protein YhfF
MPIFAIYKFGLTRLNDDGGLFAAEEAAGNAQLPAYDTPEDCFGSFFKSQVVVLPVVKSSGRGKTLKTEVEMYHGDVSAERDGVILLTLENNKEKHTIVHKKDERHEHHPFCHVVIDNRRGRQMMAIEKSAAFDGKPQKVSAILEKALADKLRPYGYGLSVSSFRRDRREFWTVVNDMRSKFDDDVKQVRLDWTGRDAEGDSGKSDVLSLLTAMAKKADSMAAVMLYRNDGEVKLERLSEDMNNLADICLRQKVYDLTVKFRKFGLYRFGADIKAQFGIEDETIDHFENGTQELDYEGGEGRFALTEWLNKIHELLEDYTDEAPVKKRRKSGSRR